MITLNAPKDTTRAGIGQHVYEVIAGKIEAMDEHVATLINHGFTVAQSEPAPASEVKKAKVAK